MRREIARLPREQRLPAVIRLLRAGDYAQFSGRKSVVKDLLAKLTGRAAIGGAPGQD